MKYLYKYPQAAYPVRRSRPDESRPRTGPARVRAASTPASSTTTATSTSIVEYAKASPEDVLVEITACNRGPEAATLHVLPTLWFRNTWSWGGDAPRPVLREAVAAAAVVAATHPDLGERFLACEGCRRHCCSPRTRRTTSGCSGSRTDRPTSRMASTRLLVHGESGAVNPERTGTKAAAHYPLTIGAGESRTIRLRLSPMDPPPCTRRTRRQSGSGPRLRRGVRGPPGARPTRSTRR